MGRKRGRYSKKPYPSNKDVIEAIIAVAYAKPVLHPDDFVDEVKKELEARGFYVGLVNARRVWNCYEKLVRRGRMPDLLSVLSAANEAFESSEELSG